MTDPMTATGGKGHKSRMLAEAALLVQRIAAGDKQIAASKRAARIVDRVLPKLTNAHSPLADNFAGFLGASRRIGDRQALYAAIYPKMLAKVQARECGAVEPVMQQGERRAA